MKHIEDAGIWVKIYQMIIDYALYNIMKYDYLSLI